MGDLGLILLLSILSMFDTSNANSSQGYPYARIGNSNETSLSMEALQKSHRGSSYSSQTSKGSPLTALSLNQDTHPTSPARHTIDPERAAKDCSNWINPVARPEVASAFTSIPAVISISGVSDEANFSLAIINKYGDQLACFSAFSQLVKTHISIYLRNCSHGKLIMEDVWPQIIDFNRQEWPGLAPYLATYGYFHIDLRTTKINQGKTEVSFIPNGDSDKKLSVNVDSSAQYVSIFATRIETAVNIISFHDGCVASKCQTLAESVGWNQTAHFLPEQAKEEGSTNQMKIYIEYCRFVEILTYPVNPADPLRWHTLSFEDDPSMEVLDNILFYKDVLIDGAVVGNLTITNNHSPAFLRVIKFCPLQEAKVSMGNATWTHKCHPTNTGNAIYNDFLGYKLKLIILFSLSMWVKLRY